MSLDQGASVPAGWYPDPQGSFQQRWWNGSSWTNEFAQYRPTLNYTQQQAVPARVAPQQQVAAPVTTTAALAGASAQQAVAASLAVSHGAHAGNAHAGGAHAGSAHEGGAHQQQPGIVQTLDREPAAAQPAPTYQQPVQQPPVQQPHPPQEQRAPVIPQFAPVPQFSQTQAPQAPLHASFQPVQQQAPSASNAALVPVPTSQQSPGRLTVNPSLQESYQPFGMIPAIRRGMREKPRTRYTAAGWLVALSPVLPIAGAWAVATYLPSFYTLFAQIGLAAVLVTLTLVFAVADRRALKLNGHEHAAWGILGAVSPLYLVLRSVVVGKETGRTAIAPLVLGLLVIAAVVAALVLQPALLPLLLTAN